ncbi:BRCA1-associated RING domain protein 1 [Salvia miltiorrhiza]|uniref:BRCA1-associated RING domain protein 1 n=1 Tax=Salvia miltiorrhiza TaxID=226208 RepID=UPI0025AD3F2D|nr:BRCA1-associated RING domain protein 1 [Salvia miltiorrhiza]
MSEIQNVARSLNPCIFHLQKLRFELNCALCLKMLNKPMLLPCNHVFCNSCVEFSIRCPACQQRFTNQEIRPAFHMENIVAIYKNLDATFNSAILPLISADSGTPVSSSTLTGQVTKNVGGTAPKMNDNCPDPSPRGIESAKCSASEELDVNHAPEVWPGSSPSSVDTKHANQHSSPGCRNEGPCKIRVKSSTGDQLGIVAGGVDTRGTYHTREPKRQKKLIYGPSGAVLQSHAYSEKIVSHLNPAVSKLEDCKSMEDASIISSTAPLDASNVDGSICALCHSSKITEGTGRMLHYAGGKEVARSQAAYSNTIPVHTKCIEWAPQVYFVDDTIVNLESEIARASKLKCSGCGLKGAALGCFVKSCRRSYHVPCAVEVPDCRWDCGEFLMLCPTHKSIKFPSEKSNSRKRPSGEKCSLPSEITPEQLNICSTSLSMPQQLVLCGSALSSEEKCLVARLAKTSGATVYKFWNPNVTHVIAATDSNGACSRTLKVLMAILNGKWVLSMDWVKACMEANHRVDEEPFEVNLDNHGCCDGPRTGRLRASKNAPKLLHGLNFYFNGDFVPAYKSDLVELVRVGGASIIESMEDAVAGRQNLEDISTTLVVYNYDSPQGCSATEASFILLKRAAEAEDVAKSIDAQLIRHTWILESIAACQILPFSL